ncbi:sufE-like protein 1, chloroplastic/mitochondrial [Magnolia sinica]|uniref:sufE-like protein 1, chloroplastic/mitochondrial n=1 Tax=Magnolia sinica TaxID=86752 RepID=UPI00265A117F|nr:sufE-like protein 1, chloroplastic/mitochondrial [Magnolia sinica]
MSLSSSFRLFSPKIPLSFPTPKPISKTTPLLFSHYPPATQISLSKTHLKTHFSSSSLSAHPNHSSESSSEDLIPPSLQSIINLFQSVQDPRAKYEQLLYYGRTLPPLEPQFKTVDNKVQGCVSQVWVHAYLDPDRNIRFEADSDSVITKGLAALLVQGLSGRPAPEIIRVPPDFIQMLGLRQSLTPSRNNGFLNMLRLMQRKALELYVEAGGDGKSVNNGVSGVVDGAAVEEDRNSVNDGVSVVRDEIELSFDSGVDSGSDDSGGKSNSEVGLGSRGERIRERLEKELCPVELEVEDISYQHAGHVGARGSDGETHFNVKIVSKEFEGKSLVKRHRLVYDILQEELKSGLHALSIVAKTPSEVSAS